MAKSRKSTDATKQVASPDINNASNTNGTDTEGVEKRKRGRPAGVGRRPKAKKPLVTKLVDGKLMKRALGMPKKVLTGKRGRPRKEYVWVEAK